MITKFELTEKQQTMIALFFKDHKCDLKNSDGSTIGGLITYSFTPTSIGIVVRVQCACGAELDLTDYDSW